MFNDTRQRIQEICNTKGYSEKMSHALFVLIEDRYFLLQQIPHYIIKNFSNDMEETVCWPCIRIFNSSTNLKIHWAKIQHDAFTNLMDGGHAGSTEACNAH